MWKKSKWEKTVLTYEAEVYIYSVQLCWQKAWWKQKLLYINRESEDFLSIAKNSVYVCMCEKSNSLNIIKKYAYTYTQRCARVRARVCVFGANKEHRPLILSYRRRNRFVLYLANQLLRTGSLSLLILEANTKSAMRLDGHLLYAKGMWGLMEPLATMEL